MPSATFVDYHTGHVDDFYSVRHRHRHTQMTLRFLTPKICEALQKILKTFLKILLKKRNRNSFY